MSRGGTETSASYSDFEGENARGTPRRYLATATQTARKETHRRVVDLQVQIQTLRQRKVILQRQVQTKVVNRVSMPELLKFKSELKAMRNRNEAMKISQMMDELAETLRAKTQARVECAALERKIGAEKKRRDEVERSSSEVSELMDFRDFGLVEMNLVALQRCECEDLEAQKRALGELKGEVLRLNPERAIFGRQKEAALEVARSTAAEVLLSKKNRNVIQMSIDTMRSMLKEVEADIGRVEGENRILANRKDRTERDGSRKAVDSEQSNKRQSAMYKSELRQLDEEIAQLVIKIDQSAEMYDKICVMISDLQNRGAEVACSQSGSEIFELMEEEEEQSDLGGQTADVEEMFRQQKVELERDVQRLRIEYETQRSIRKAEQAKLKERIHQLYCKLHSNERLIAYFEDASQSSYHSVYDLLHPVGSGFSDSKAFV